METILTIFTISFILLGLISQAVQMIVIVPYVLKNRPEKFWDRIPGTHQYKNLREYKIWCVLNQKTIFWYKFQIYIISISGIFFLFSFLLMVQIYS